MPKESKVYEEKDDDGKIILKLEGKEIYYRYSPFDQIDLKAKRFIDIRTFADENGISEGIDFDAVCAGNWTSLAVIGAPETSTRNIVCRICTGLNPEEGPHVSIECADKKWWCDIYVPEELNQKLIEAYRSNRIENLIITIIASRPEGRAADFMSPDSKDHLWSEGSDRITVGIHKSIPLFLRPDDNGLHSAYAFWKSITYTDPPIVAKNTFLGKEEEKSNKKDLELEHQKTFSQDELAAKLSDLNSTISDVKKYIKLGVIFLFAIVVMLML